LEEETKEGREEGYHVCSESAGRFSERNLDTFGVRWNKSPLRA
jgi:hypothetical protein